MIFDTLGTPVYNHTGRLEQVLPRRVARDLPAARAWLSTTLAGSCVFALYNAAMSAVTIIATQDLLSRWTERQVLSDEPLELAAVWRTDRPEVLEAELHRKFAPHLLYGRWYSADAVLGHTTPDVAA